MALALRTAKTKNVVKQSVKTKLDAPILVRILSILSAIRVPRIQISIIPKLVRMSKSIQRQT